MKRNLSVILVLAVVLALVSATPAIAKQPLSGDLDLEFNLGIETGPFPGISWVGTVDFDGVVYGIAYFDAGVMRLTGTVSHWLEDWKIYAYDLNAPFFEFTGGILTEFAPGSALMEGHDNGISNPNNDTWGGSGIVDDASGPFEGWAGRRVHEDGTFEWYPFGAPHFAFGTLRLN